ncbi:MAG TPA: polysaccharide biosynthesis/export family protein [Nitrospira sp.]|nr:polysaccharide biosynthesis/export family protein [Nitrospira sp.]
MQFNPDYLVSVGDALQVRLWGAFTIDGAYTVDPQGNIFLPHVGPVKVQGVRNDDLQRTVEGAVKKVFRANVFSYASLAAAQPVRVFVGGYVKRPGLFNGTSMDSLLNYLDQAGGIDPERGSFLNVEVKRGNTLRASVNLYDFLLLGRMPLVQLADGDVIFVNSRQNTVKVNGLVANAKRFEFVQAEYAVSDLIRLAKPEAQVTHVRIVRNSAPVRNTEYFPLDRVGQLVVRNGDELEFTSDKKPGTITVRVEGEHQSAQEYVLPYGARLGEIMKKIEFSERSDDASLQLFRQSVKERQKIMLNTALKSLESSVLTARSSTNEESRLRTEEAALILQWVERARQIEPSGQVMIAQASEKDSLLLENGDVIRVPVRDGLVLVSGEVLFPNAIAHDRALELKDYIRRAGGYSQSADTSRVIVSHRDGGFEEAETGGFWNAGNDLKVRPGDEILVLPKIQTKNIEVTRGLTQILYQLAISAKVILDL